jgi:hypothetical protein
MTREQELILISARLRKMIAEKNEIDSNIFIRDVETLLTLLEEHLED